MRTLTWKRLAGLALGGLLLAATLAPRGGLAEEFFLFTSFRGNGEDGLHLAKGQRHGTALRVPAKIAGALLALPVS